MKKLTATVFIVFVGSMFAQDKPPEPYHIKSDVLGETMSAYRQNNPECKDSESGLPNFYHATNSPKLSGTCIIFGLDSEASAGSAVNVTYADAPVKYKIATFDEDRLVQLLYGMKHYLYTHMRDNLIAKFGQPGTKETEDLQNRMGAHFSGEVLMWDNSVSSILLNEYSGDLDSSSLTFTMNDYLKQQRQRKAAKKASSDM